MTNYLLPAVEFSYNYLRSRSKIEKDGSSVYLQHTVPKKRTTYWCEFIKVQQLEQKHHVVMVGCLLISPSVCILRNTFKKTEHVLCLTRITVWTSTTARQWRFSSSHCALRLLWRHGWRSPWASLGLYLQRNASPRKLLLCRLRMGCWWKCKTLAILLCLRLLDMCPL